MWSLSRYFLKQKNVFYINFHAASAKYLSSESNPTVIGDYLKEIKDKTSDKDKIKKIKLVTNPICVIDEASTIMNVNTFDKNNDFTPIPVLEDVNMKILSFDEVPGPKILKTVANVWKFFPAAGSYFKLSDKLKLMSYLFDEYGPVVRVVGPFGGDVVLLDRPEDMRSVFNQEGPLPVRSIFDSLEYYRLKHRRYEFSGLLLLQGEEWGKQRVVIEKNLLDTIGQVNAKLEMSSEELIDIIPKIRNLQNQVPSDFENKIFKWSLECMGNVLFSERLGLLEFQDPPQGDALWLEEALTKVTSALASCETGLQAWKFMTTPQLKSLISSCTTLDGLVGNFIRQAETEIITQNKRTALQEVNLNGEFEPSSQSFIKTLINIEKMKSEDILTSLLDMLIIGVNSTTSAMSFILYHLAKGQKVQNKLFEELKYAMPDRDTSLSPEGYRSLPYLQSCIKESLRIVPPIPVISRVLPTSIVVDGYRIPRGTLMLLATQVSGLKEENFEDAKRYYPDRWLSPDIENYHPFSMLPYSYGPRKCIGQAIAELEISILTAKIFRRFKVEYNYGDIVPRAKLISKPNRPLRFRFIDRE